MNGRLVVALFLGLLLPRAAAAQTWEDYDYENLQFRGLGLEFGMVMPTEIEPSASFGARADMGYVGPHVRVVPGIRFWSSRLRQSELRHLAEQLVRLCERQSATGCPASLDLGEIRRSDLELGTDAHYVFGEPGAFSPYAGGGVGLHLLNGQGAFIDDTFVEDLLDTVAPGASLVAGLHVPLGSALQLLAETRVLVTSDVQYANFVAGGSWTIPSPPRNRASALRLREGR